MKTALLVLTFVSTVFISVAADTLAKVTKKAFLDITIDDQPAGRIVVGLFGDVAPKTVANFAQLCDGSAGFSY